MSAYLTNRGKQRLKEKETKQNQNIIGSLDLKTNHNRGDREVGEMIPYASNIPQMLRTVKNHQPEFIN
jgi:hypothetical protein